MTPAPTHSAPTHSAPTSSASAGSAHNASRTAAAARLARPLSESDPEVARILGAETQRQQRGLQLIASENVVSSAVMEAMSSVLTNKYAEGRPGRRYYSGCEHADEVERLVQDRARELFGTDYHVNAQPHSGTQANLSVYLATLRPGERILALDLDHGGHLSHGSRFNASGKLYEAHFYGVDPSTERIDMDEVARKAEQVRPQVLVCGASAYPRTIDFGTFGEIARSVGALLLADVSHIAGLIAAGEHPSPFGHADFVTTTTHKTLRGPRGGLVFCREALRRKCDSAIFPGTQGGPLMHQVAGKAVALGEALEPEFKVYQQAVRANARALAERLEERGYRLVSGGTDNHMVLVDVGERMTGEQAEEALRERQVFVNKNLIPFDRRSSKETSGIRIGTPTMTSHGFGEAEFVDVASLIADVLDGVAASDAAG